MVSYVWTGFFQPVDNNLVNTAKAGQSTATVYAGKMQRADVSQVSSLPSD